MSRLEEEVEEARAGMRLAAITVISALAAAVLTCGICSWFTYKVLELGQ